MGKFTTTVTRSIRKAPTSFDRTVATIARQTAARNYKANLIRAMPMTGILRSVGNQYRGTRDELKCLDIPIAAPAGGGLLPIYTASAFAEPAAAFAGITELNDVQQGATVYQRIGTKIQMKSIRVSFTVAISALALINNASVRWMIVYDRQVNGVGLTLATLIADSTAAAATGFHSGINIANRSRFLILRDQEITIENGGPQIHNVSDYIKLNNLEAEYRASGATIGDIATGALYLVILSDVLTVNSPLLLDMNCRLRYVD